MRKSICFTALAAILLVMLSALMLSLVSCKKEPAEKFSVNFIVEGTEYASIATAGEERISIPISPSKTYYTFGGWYRDKDVWNDKFTADSLVDERLTADLSVYARFIPVEYKATFKAGDNVVAEIPFTVETESITPPAVPEHDGYTGGAWESFTLGMENITVNAVYTIVPYTIIYNNVNGATNRNPAGYDVEDQPLALLDPSKAGYDFLGWYTDAEFTNKLTKIAVGTTGNIELWAKWEAVVYTATFKDGDTVVAEIPFTVETESITPPAVPEHAGYTGAWKSFTLGTKNITVNAVYTAIPYDIIYNNVSGATNSNPATYTVDQAITLIDAYKSDEAFVGWYSEPEFNNRITEIPQGTTGEITLYAKWVYAIEISTAEQLRNIRLNQRYILTCDIDLGGAEWTPIGTWNSPFTGSLDGDGYKITNFKITTGMNYVGLVGYSKGTLLNLGVEDFEIDVTYSDDVLAGGLVGYNSGEITNCYATGDVSASSNSTSSTSYSYAGGLAGVNNSTITNCYATGDVSASSNSSSSESYAGGLVGHNIGEITNCYATGDVSATSSGSSYYDGYSYAGGLVGRNYGEITNCYATGDVSATSSGSSYSDSDSYAGGLVGDNNYGTITNCYATGDVSASSNSTSSESYAGGLVGYNNNNGRITTCYRYSGQSFTVDKNGTVSNSATNTIGTEKTMEELLSVSFQTETLGCSADDWTFTEGEHPVLKNVGLTE